MGTASEIESTQSGTEPEWTCVTCGQQASRDFCSRCGEKRRQHHDFSLRHIFSDLVEAFFHVDSKVYLTLKTLIFRPGRLTSEFFLGRRKPYMSPLQTFLVCNLLFFVLQPLTGLEILARPLRVFENSMFFKPFIIHLVDQRLAKKHLSRTNPEQFIAFTERFDRVSHLQAKSLILVLAPVLAVVMAGLNFRRRRYFSEHLIFAVHVYAWWLLWLLLILVLMSLTRVLARITGQSMACIRSIFGRHCWSSAGWACTCFLPVEHSMATNC